MKAKKTKIKGHELKKRQGDNTSGYPLYPPGEDIYGRYREEKDINPEDITRNKDAIEDDLTENQKDFEDVVTGEDLDIPGADLDDTQEEIGSEDEENNYYSLGGDNHNDLEENDLE